MRSPYMFSTYRRGVGTQASEVEMGVAGLKRVERPGDSLDSLRHRATWRWKSLIW